MSASSALFIELKNELAEVARLAALVEDYCDEHGLPPKVAFNLNLVLEEVVVNVIHYAFPDGDAQEPIFVSVALEPAEGKPVRVVCEVRATGVAFDPLVGGPPDFELDLESRQVGGLGVHFLRTLMDEVAYARTERHNCLRFSKALDAA